MSHSTLEESVDQEKLQHLFLDWRNISTLDACLGCHGSGRKVYGTTAQWRGGIGGAALTPGPCDECWGSGSGLHPGVDLRKYEREMAERDALLGACGWLAEVVIKDQGGTPDPAGWVKRGKTFYRDALDRADSFEAMLRRIVIRLKKSSEPSLKSLAEASTALLKLKGADRPQRG